MAAPDDIREKRSWLTHVRSGPPVALGLWTLTLWAVALAGTFLRSPRIQEVGARAVGLLLPTVALTALVSLAAWNRYGFACAVAAVAWFAGFSFLSESTPGAGFLQYGMPVAIGTLAVLAGTTRWHADPVLPPRPGAGA